MTAPKPMLGVAVPGWPADAKKEALVKSLVLEVIALFGPKRAMFNSNWHFKLVDATRCRCRCR